MKPTVGRIVLYKHPLHPEGGYWPALILEITEHPGGVLDPPGAVEVLCHLQIFRPRGNEWKRVIEGIVEGTWCWPERDPKNDLPIPKGILK